jgi:hypothetical protein
MVHAIRSPSGKKLRIWKHRLLFLKMMAFLFFLVGMATRYAPHDSTSIYPKTFRWARILLSIDICLYFVRGSELFLINKDLGPKLTMTYKMVWAAKVSG